MKHLTGKIIFSVTRSNDDKINDTFHLRIEDDRSHLVILDARIQPADFALALSSRYQPVSIELNTNPDIGRQHENKKVAVAFETPRGTKAEQQTAAEAALIPYEVDGWTGRINDLLNHHNTTDGKTYTVVFVRWVD